MANAFISEHMLGHPSFLALGDRVLHLKELHEKYGRDATKKRLNILSAEYAKHEQRIRMLANEAEVWEESLNEVLFADLERGEQPEKKAKKKDKKKRKRGR